VLIHESRRRRRTRDGAKRRWLRAEVSRTSAEGDSDREVVMG
jgi:hypothetical protein